MTALQPLLGERRRAQIERALACYDPRPIARLTDETPGAALAALAAGASVKQVAAELGVTVWCVYDLRLGRTYPHVARPAPVRRAA